MDKGEEKAGKGVPRLHARYVSTNKQTNAEDG